MRRWPSDRAAQAGIAFAIALCAAGVAYAHVEHSHLALYAAEYPHDGQVGLQAFVDALEAGGLTFILVLVGTYLAQRIFTAGDLGGPGDG